MSVCFENTIKRVRSKLLMRRSQHSRNGLLKGEPLIQSTLSFANESEVLNGLEQLCQRRKHGALLIVKLPEEGRPLLSEWCRQQMGKRLREVMEGDVTALAHSEFAVVLEHFHEHLADAVLEVYSIAAQILNEFTVSMDAGLGGLHGPVAIGATVFGRVQVSPAAILANARFATYRAMVTETSSIRFHDPAFDGILTCHQELKAGIEGGQFVIEYEPVANTGSHMAVLEARLHWRHPEYGKLSHQELLQFALEAGMGSTLATWILEQIVRRLAHWQQEVMKAQFVVAVRMDLLLLSRFDFVNQVIALVANLGMQAGTLMIKLEQDARIDDAATQSILRLQKVGVLVELNA